VRVLGRGEGEGEGEGESLWIGEWEGIRGIRSVLWIKRRVGGWSTEVIF